VGGFVKVVLFFYGWAYALWEQTKRGCWANSGWTRLVGTYPLASKRRTIKREGESRRERSSRMGKRELPSSCDQ